jgi:putative ABC transport system substrate-binding protein
MRRRDFLLGAIGFLTSGGVSRAQQSRRIAILSGFTDERQEANQIGIFKQMMKHLGWQEGRNLQVDHRRVPKVDMLPAAATDILASSPDAILVMPTPALAALHRLNKTIPTVFAFVSDPVEGGFVQSLARPGGNVTGFTAFEYSIGGKWLETLKEIQPGLSRVVVLLFHENYTSRGLLSEIERAGPKLGIAVHPAPIKGADDIERALDAFGTGPDGGVIALPHPAITNNMKLIFSLATRNRLPGMYPFRQFAENGGLASYGSLDSEMFKQVAVTIDRVLKGENPAALPVQNPTKFELVINLYAAKAINLTVPPALLVRADQVIE